ncbi:hypothetical protein LTR36_010998 [Oleoguttula mirabilis]|uniref:Uncharacterized protein n=1 Tax=Oleoguttula mirabilis TaxID=1507867 RepID=A0AAV9J3B1_9PEZI|nr:hypothetical protein LTR36_010998 [Oleoguttula mirabilis]
MGGKDSDKGGLPDDVFQQMQAGHEKYMRDLDEGDRRFQQELDRAYNNAQHHINQANKLPPTSPLPSDKERNIFVTFKDLVDANLNSLTESFRSLPSNIAELRAKMQEEKEARKAEELAVWRRWTGLEDSPDHVQMVSERASSEQREEAVSATLMLLRAARDRNAHVPAEKVAALYKDGHGPMGSLDLFAAPMLAPGGGCHCQPDSGHNAPSTLAMGRTGMPDYRWLSVDWFKRSPYSPVSLEQHPDLGDFDSDWRAAFEDLLNAALDKPMVSREQWGYRPNGNPQSTFAGPGLDWMLSLQCRGILPPQLPSSYNARWPSRSRQGSALDLAAVEKQLLSSAPAWRSHAGTVVGDIQELVDEVSTPAPEQGFPKCEDWRPETEQDLYDGHSQASRRDYQEQMKLLGQQDIPLPLGLHETLERERLAAHRAGSPEEDEDEDEDVDGTSSARALQDYQKQLELLHQQSFMRLLHAGQDPDEMTRLAAEDGGEAEPVRRLAVVQEQVIGALFDGDGDAAVESLDRWRMDHGSVDELMQSLREAFSTGCLSTDMLRDMEDAVSKAVRGRETELFRMLRGFKEMAERRQQEYEALGLYDDEDMDEEEYNHQRPPLDDAALPAKREGQSVMPPDVPPAKVDVLSSLTTSHTTRLPDGTVTTKVVLKQRFADGREETEEKVHTYQEAARQQPGTGEQQQEEGKPRKNGWFWT